MLNRLALEAVLQDQVWEWCCLVVILYLAVLVFQLFFTRPSIWVLHDLQYHQTTRSIGYLCFCFVYDTTLISTSRSLPRDGKHMDTEYRISLASSSHISLVSSWAFSCELHVPVYVRVVFRRDHRLAASSSIVGSLGRRLTSCRLCLHCICSLSVAVGRSFFAAFVCSGGGDSDSTLRVNPKRHRVLSYGPRGSLLRKTAFGSLLASMDAGLNPLLCRNLRFESKLSSGGRQAGMSAAGGAHEVKRCTLSLLWCRWFLKPACL